MQTRLELLTPGIINIFESEGWKCYVADIEGQCQVTVVKGGQPFERTFPWPSTNRELTPHLFAWRDALKGI